MPAPVNVRQDYTPSQLRDIAETLTDIQHARRLRAIAAVLEGQSRTQAASIGGMERQTLRDWVHRFNNEGPDGLKNLTSPGRPPKLDAVQRAALQALISNPQAYGLHRWRLADLVRVIRERFGVEHDEVSVGRIMKRLGYRYTGVEWRRATPVSKSDGETNEPREAASARATAYRAQEAVWDC